MENPYKALGKIEKGQVNYNFKACLEWMEQAGKNQFYSDFIIHEEDHALLYKLLTYAVGDRENMTRLNLNPNRGILLSGPVGAGKTTIMTLINPFFPKEKRYSILPSRELIFRFLKEGYPVIQTFGKESFNLTNVPALPKIYCFDDLGVEQTVKYFGNDCNVMGEILLSRYDQFIKHRMLTHVTTNLTATEVENLYGQRVRSRMREMFNLISFDKNTKDKRV